MSAPHPDDTQNVVPQHVDPQPVDPQHVDPQTPPVSPPAYAPGYPPGPPMPPAAKKSHLGRIIALVVGGLVLLLAIGGTIVYLTVGDKISNVAASTQTRLVLPDQLGGRERNNEPEFVEPTTQLVTMLKQSQPAATSTIGGFYGTGEKKDLAMVAGTSGVDLNSAHTLDEVIKGLNTTLPLTGMTPVDAGPLGGQAQCGSANAGGVPLGVCLWTDAGSTGMVMLYFRTAEQTVGEFPALRSQIEQRA